MNKSILLFLIIIVGCAAPEVEKQELQLPDSFSYKGKKPSMADSSLLIPVIEWNQRVSDLNPEMSDLFADSITWHWASGVEYTYSKDSLLSMIRTSFEQTKRIDITIAAAIPVHYSDANDSWVYSWIYEEVEDLDGLTRSHYLHEDFRIVNGVIREIYQFKRDKSE